jgi:pimeloyl-ACP methyl ester carboxylesterase
VRLKCCRESIDAPKLRQNNGHMSDGKVSAASNDWRTLYPFAPHWLKMPGGRMHYLDEGPADAGSQSAETLLFVHGNPTWSFHWRRLVNSLCAKYRCIAPDHLGCGRSDKPARFMNLSDHIAHLSALVRELDLRRVVLVAQDWGGAIGLGTMLALSDRLERIVLFNTGAFPPAYIPRRIRVCRTPLVGRLAVQGCGLFNRAALRMTLARRARLDAAVAAAYTSPYGNWGDRRAIYGFVKDIPSGPRDATWRTLADIEWKLPSLADRPALLVWGMLDWCFRPDCLERFEAVWPQAEVHRLADVGHWVMEDAPEDAVPLVEKFLESTQPSASGSFGLVRSAGVKTHG